jgi:hypothetical protein
MDNTPAPMGAHPAPTVADLRSGLERFGAELVDLTRHHDAYRRIAARRRSPQACDVAAELGRELDLARAVVGRYLSEWESLVQDAAQRRQIDTVLVGIGRRLIDLAGRVREVEAAWNKPPVTGRVANARSTVLPVRLPPGPRRRRRQ